MQIYLIISGIGMIGGLIIGFYILRINPREKLNRLFFLKCLCLSIFLTLALMTQFAAEANVTLLNRLTMSSGAILIALLLQFYLELTKTSVSKRMTLLLLMLPVAIIFIIFLTTPVEYVYVQPEGYWQFIPDYGGFYTLCWLPYLITHFVMFILLLTNRWWKTTLNKEKKQSIILIATMVLCLFIIVFGDWIMPLFGFRTPYLGVISATFYMFTLCFVLIRYHFLTFEISNISSQILSNIQELVLVLGLDGRIIFNNNQSAESLSIAKGKLKGRNYHDIIVSESPFVEALNDLKEGKIQSFKYNSSFGF